MSNPFMPAQTSPPPQDTTTNDFKPTMLDGTVRDAKGRIPDSLNVGGTHTAKRHPATRHFKD